MTGREAAVSSAGASSVVSYTAPLGDTNTRGAPSAGAVHVGARSMRSGQRSPSVRVTVAVPSMLTRTTSGNVTGVPSSAR